MTTDDEEPQTGGHKGTRTSDFGYSRRENHDSGRFYRQFAELSVSTDSTLGYCELRNTVLQGDARDLPEIPDNSVALVVTSPPYFAAKEYETDDSGSSLQSFEGYIEMIEDSIVECRRVLEPGGRIAINVANIGRRPYRSLSAIVIRLLEECGFLLRGEIIWVKATGARGNVAWGSFRSASNPVLRDVTERVIIASKGRFDRTPSRSEREKANLPHVDTISSEQFMDSTLDTWSIPPDSAKRVGHPAPFPVELPRRLIELFTYKGDLVLDPFCGSGSTCLAALQSGRDFIGVDLDESYVELSRSRVAAFQPQLPEL